MTQLKKLKKPSYEELRSFKEDGCSMHWTQKLVTMNKKMFHHDLIHRLLLDGNRESSDDDYGEIRIINLSDQYSAKKLIIISWNADVRVIAVRYAYDRNIPQDYDPEDEHYTVYPNRSHLDFTFKITEPF